MIYVVEYIIIAVSRASRQGFKSRKTDNFTGIASRVRKKQGPLKNK